MNNYTMPDGVQLVAVDARFELAPGAWSCEGCYLNPRGCMTHPTPCAASEREDGRDVIWVEKYE